MYDDHACWSCMMIIYDNHIWSSYMMIVGDHHIWWKKWWTFRNLFSSRNVWGPLGYVLASWLVPKKLSRPSNDQLFCRKQMNRPTTTQNHRTVIFHYSNNSKVPVGATNFSLPQSRRRRSSSALINWLHLTLALLLERSHLYFGRDWVLISSALAIGPLRAGCLTERGSRMRGLAGVGGMVFLCWRLPRGHNLTRLSLFRVLGSCHVDVDRRLLCRGLFKWTWIGGSALQCSHHHDSCERLLLRRCLDLI